MTNQKVSDALKQLEALNQQASIDIFVPSLKRTVKFKNLTLKQQKSLLKSSIDETLTKLSFGTNFYQIIKENITEPINIDQLYAFDRIAIAITLRANGLDKIYTEKDKQYNLDDLINNIQGVAITQDVLEETMEIDGMKITVAAPSLKVDRDLSNYALNKISGLTAADIKTIISELFIYEVIKFIKTLTFTVNETENVIDLSLLKIDERVSLAEKLPVQVTNKILDFIKKYRQLESNLTKLDDINIEVDGSFFTI
jgi:hypothetical protein